MASNVPWEWTQLKTEYGFLESFYESTSSCQGQGVTVARPRPADSRVQFAVSQKKNKQQKQAKHFFQRPNGRHMQGIQP